VAFVRGATASVGVLLMLGAGAAVVGFLVVMIDGELFAAGGPGFLGGFVAFALLALVLLGGGVSLYVAASGWNDPDTRGRSAAAASGLLLFLGIAVGPWFLATTVPWVALGITAVMVATAVGFAWRYLTSKVETKAYGGPSLDVSVPSAARCIGCGKPIAASAMTMQAVTPLGVRPLCSGACRDRWVSGLLARSECAMCGATGTVAKLGGLGEPYCSEACYQRVGSLVSDDFLHSISPGATIHHMG
jgi:hypothetical protein